MSKLGEQFNRFYRVLRVDEEQHFKDFFYYYIAKLYLNISIPLYFNA